MASISQTAANVVSVADDDNEFEYGTYGATVAAGKPVYFDEADEKYKLCDCNSGTAAVRDFRGIALQSGSDGQPAKIQTGGTINLGATLAVGMFYVVSDTAGEIMPVTDLSSGEYPILIGGAITAANLKMAGPGNRTHSRLSGFKLGVAFA